jgi:6-phosphogluconolactonase
MAARGAEKDRFLVYVGSYAGARSKGIYAWRFDAATGIATPLGLAAEAVNPSFLAVHPSNRYLYATSEVGNRGGQPVGGVEAFAIDAASGKLTPLNQVSSRGAGPAFVAVDRTGSDVLVANYSGGSIAVCPIKEDGRLGEATAFVQHEGSSINRMRQREPHAHSINVSPDNRFAIAADLGLDKLLIYRFDAAKGTLAPNDPPFAAVKPGSGPRHFTFHPSGRFAYAINELASTVMAFSYDAARGALSELQTVSTLPSGFLGDSTTAEVQVDAAGRFLYGSNRGHDSIAVFAIDAATGTLTPVEYVSTRGRTPRNFRIDPTGRYLFAANQDSGNVAIFRIDARTGRLTATGKALEVGSPVCVKFVPVE